jgi:hypothetical protein
VISDSDQSDAAFYPRLLIHKDVATGADTPITFCEYADGDGSGTGLAQIDRVTSFDAAVVAMRTPLNMGIGSVDCDSGQTGGSPVNEILVPGSAANPTYYDVAATFSFGAALPDGPPEP